MRCAPASLAARRYGQSLHLPVAALTASLHRRAAPPATARFSSSSSSSSSASPAALYDYFPATLPEGAPPRGRFAVDVTRLRREFLRLQAAHHPDKHPPAQRPAAEARSVAINHAFRTLADPLLRAQYLLSLRGLEVAADEHWRPPATSHHGPHTPHSCDARLLHDVMDAYDLLDEAAAPEDLDPLRRANDVRLADCEDALERAFARDDVAAASREAVTLRYWVNIRNALRAWEPGKPLSLKH